MSIIKNLRLLASTLRPEEIDRLEAGANLHKRYSNIEFKILRYDVKEIVIQTHQGKHLSKNYADQKILIERTKQLFQPVIPQEIKIVVHAIPFVEHHVTDINAEWLEHKMLQSGIKIKDIVEDTGLDKTNISAWLNNKRPMSQIAKAMFQYYFMAKMTQNNSNDWVTDEKVVIELERRSNEYKSGKVKGISWEVAKKQSAHSQKSKRI